MINELEENAYEDILEVLEEGEVIEAIVFEDPKDIYSMESYSIPKENIGVPISLEQARPYLKGWTVYGSYGCEEVIPFYVWTNFRVLFIGSYDGSTWLTGVPRNPISCNPYTIGGG